MVPADTRASGTSRRNICNLIMEVVLVDPPGQDCGSSGSPLSSQILKDLLAVDFVWGVKFDGLHFPTGKGLFVAMAYAGRASGRILGTIETFRSCGSTVPPRLLVLPHNLKILWARLVYLAAVPEGIHVCPEKDAFYGKRLL